MKTLIILVGLVLAGCCPKGGMDRSHTVDNYAVAIDYYSQGAPIIARLASSDDTRVELFNSAAQSEKHDYINYDSKIANRIIYYFSAAWSAEQINSLNIRYLNFEQNSISFNAIEKASYQREPHPYNQYFSKSISYLDQLECVIHAVTEIFIPRAQAFSCPVSDSSVISYRAGTLIRVDLN